MAPANSSRIPHRPPTPAGLLRTPKYTPSSGTKRLGLRTTRRDGRKSPGPSPLSQPPQTLSPSPSPSILAANIPLSSSPAEQPDNPASLADANLTLIDATAACMPSNDDWPILQPVNIEEAAPINAANTPETPDKKWSFDSSREPPSYIPRRSIHFGSKRVPASPSLPATPRSEGPNSPAARKKEKPFGVITPPPHLQKRKRSSLPVQAHTVVMAATDVSISHTNSTGLEYTQWPQLEVDSAPKPTPKPELSPTEPTDEGTTETYESPEPELGFDLETGSRVGRLSSHLSTTGCGPVLTISGDADAVLLGRHEAPSRKLSACVLPIRSMQPSRQSSVEVDLGSFARLSTRPPPVPPKDDPVSPSMLQPASSMCPTPSPVQSSATAPVEMQTATRINNAPSLFAARIARSRGYVQTPYPGNIRSAISSTPGNEGLAPGSSHRGIPGMKQNTERSCFNTSRTARTPQDSKPASEDSKKLKFKKSLRNMFQKRPKTATSSEAKTHDKGETAIQTVPAQNPTSPSSVENHTTRLMEALLGRINATPVGSEERVRAVQIAEVLVHCVESCCETRVAAAKAEEFARAAELYADSVSIHLHRLGGLIKPSFDSEAVEAIKELIRSATVSE